ncbi:hypothetical protein HWV62_34179 [Athelia sp. TMB]|nr:hypothetical protein HWV62_34179 [Athelia sp. TMB]
MKWNGPTLAHKTYDADLAFGPNVSNDVVYERTVIANDMLNLVLSGGIGCVVAYGQTGSGKTYTMFDTAKSVGKRLLDSEGTNSSDGSSVFEFSVSFLELLGKRASDLVASHEMDSDGEPIRQEIVIRENKVGDVLPDLISTSVTSSEDLATLITTSPAHRRTSATLRNVASSRSHAVLTIRIKNTLLPHADDGQLILVDLAGSERYEDSHAHSKERMAESMENNKGLMNLKDCVSATAKMSAVDTFVHVPWRSNKLTMLLKPIFDVESCRPTRTVIIFHVSPHIQDAIHSTNTLSYASAFKAAPTRRKTQLPYDLNDPRTWDHEATLKWVQEKFQNSANEIRQTNHQDGLKHHDVGIKTAATLGESGPYLLG